MKLHVRVWSLIVLPVVPSFGQAPQNYLRNNSFVNRESAHVHPLDMTPDGTKLLAVNAQAKMLLIFNAASPAKPTRVPINVEQPRALAPETYRN